ncbi:MAG: glycosyltransferase family 9 protein [Candidatus Omnitrophica bacterium]|nr:glycosyltransferase family 9 protein [Candidatus Omnitrophota bacterium]MBU0895032.1 glycosyltransferase family 9 protein [Candidatus Omnitrophota bacterium]MBU1038566.1 glycosyltransferase family 9 protein [Candidatus Omnitrophota bacterium]MBU1808630.1 glycosyltransferase family 9 protein [Candidatus Omnitrophota bacterium]
MIIDKADVKRILVITLTNLGDIILTTPVIATLRREFPAARIDVLLGPAGREVFEKDRNIFKVIIYDKHMPLAGKRRLQLKLKKLKYDLVVDLKNTVIGLLIGPKYRTATIQHFPSGIIHSIDKHLHRLKSLGLENFDRYTYLYITPEDEAYVSGLLKASGVRDSFVVINAGAKSHLKRWTQEGFADLADRIAGESKADIVFIGTKEDEAIVGAVINKMKQKSHNFIGKTGVRQLGSLLKRSKLLVTNDSAPLHIGCAIGARVLAIFGPTDPGKYGPTGEYDAVISKKLFCSPCEEAACKSNYECMSLILPADVYDSAKIMIEGYE